MKKLLKSIDWKKLLRYELYCLLVLMALYVGSLLNGRNKFPEHIYMIPIIMGLWSLLLFISSFSEYLVQKSKQNGKKIRNK